MRTQEEEEREGMRQSDPDRALLREKGLVAICVITFVTMPVHNDNKLKPVFCNGSEIHGGKPPERSRFAIVFVTKGGNKQTCAHTRAASVRAVSSWRKSSAGDCAHG